MKASQRGGGVFTNPLCAREGLYRKDGSMGWNEGCFRYFIIIDHFVLNVFTFCIYENVSVYFLRISSWKLKFWLKGLYILTFDIYLLTVVP